MAVKTSARQPKIELIPPSTPLTFDVELDLDSNETVEESSFKAASATKEPKMADFPGKSIKANDGYLFWEWADKLTDDDWTRINCYLYRLHPIINRRYKNPSAVTNIDKFMSRFTLDHVKESHGSGEYRLVVNDSNKTVGGKGGQIGEVYISINDPMFPAKLILEELDTSHPNNRKYVEQLKAEGKITNEGNVTNTQTQSNSDAGLLDLVKDLIRNNMTQARAAANVPKDVANDAVTTMMMNAHTQSLQLVKDQIKGDDPDKLVKLLAILVPLMSPKPVEDNTSKLMLQMMQIQSDNAASREAMMLKMFEMNKPKESSEDMEDKILNRFEKMKDLFGGSGEAGGVERKKSLAELAIEHGAPVLDTILKGAMQFISIKNFEAGLRQQANPNTTPQQTTVVEQPIAIEGSNVIEMPTPIQETKQPSMLIQYGGYVLNALKMGVTGDKFAESVETMTSPLVYNQLAGMGKEAIINEMKSVPAFWQTVEPFAGQLEAFIEEFIAYGQEEEEGA